MLIVSIILEAAVAVIAVLAAMQGRPYLYGLVFTFAEYVLMISLVCCNGPSKERCSRDYSCSRPSRRSSRFGRCTGKAGRASGKSAIPLIQYARRGISSGVTELRAFRAAKSRLQSPLIPRTGETR